MAGTDFRCQNLTSKVGPRAEGVNEHCTSTGLFDVTAFIHGDPKVLLYPTDSDGNLCGSGELEWVPHATWQL